MNRLLVIVPFYKNDKIDYLSKSINSLSSQTYKNFDIIVAVDGPIISEQKQYLTDLEKKTSLEVIYYPINRGLPAVLNDCIATALERGYQYIARMDADDICLPMRLEKQMSFLELNPSVSLVGTQVNLIDNYDNIIGEKYVHEEATFKTLQTRIDINHPTVLFRSAFFQNYGYYNPKYKNAQDWDLWLRATKKGAVLKNINEKLYCLRYDRDVVKRRKRGQKYRIYIKFKHFGIFRALISSIPNILVIIMPAPIIRFVLNSKNRRLSKTLAVKDK